MSTGPAYEGPFVPDKPTKKYGNNFAPSPTRKSGEKKRPDKKLLKHLRTIAQKLPVRYYQATVYEVMRGWEIIEKNITVHGIETIDPAKRYRLKGTKRLPVNHYQKMKGLFCQGGRQAVNDYIVQLMPEIGEYFKQKSA